MENLLLYDRILFSLINGLPHTWWSDAFFLALSGAGAYGLGWIFFGLYLFINNKRPRNKYFLAGLAAVGIVGFIVVEYLLKPLIGRTRPDAISGAIIVAPTFGESYSFPSGHAFMAFAAAGYLSAFYPEYRFFMYFLAVQIGFSRVYLGRHFPLDVVAGGISGYALSKAVTIILDMLKNSGKSAQVKTQTRSARKRR